MTDIKKNIYTYVVDHKNESPEVQAGDKIKGGDLMAVAFYDGLDKLEKLEEFVNHLRVITTSSSTKKYIDYFLRQVG